MHRMQMRVTFEWHRERRCSLMCARRCGDQGHRRVHFFFPSAFKSNIHSINVNCYIYIKAAVPSLGVRASPLGHTMIKETEKKKKICICYKFTSIFCISILSPVEYSVVSRFVADIKKKGEKNRYPDKEVTLWWVYSSCDRDSHAKKFWNHCPELNVHKSKPKSDLNLLTKTILPALIPNKQSTLNASLPPVHSRVSFFLFWFLLFYFPFFLFLGKRPCRRWLFTPFTVDAKAFMNWL